MGNNDENSLGALVQKQRLIDFLVLDKRDGESNTATRPRGQKEYSSLFAEIDQSRQTVEQHEQSSGAKKDLLVEFPSTDDEKSMDGESSSRSRKPRGNRGDRQRIRKLEQEVARL